MNEIVQQQQGQLELKNRNEASNVLIQDILKELDQDYNDFLSAIEKSSSIEHVENALAVFMNKTTNFYHSVVNLRITLNQLSEG